MNDGQSQIANDRPRRGSFFTRWLSYGLFGLVFLYTGVMGTLSLIASLFDGSGRVQHWFARAWSWMMLKTGCIRVQATGLEHIHPDQPAVYVANHLSAADIPVLYATLPMQFRILAKQELFRYPFLGWYLRRSGQIPIVYGDANAGLRSLNQASESLRHGTPLVIFPEGGRSETGQLQAFLAGAFYVAIRAQAPVVPVTIVGTYEVLPMNSFHVLPGTVNVIIGKPISTRGMRLRDMERLSAEVRQLIAETYNSHAKVALEEVQRETAEAGETQT